MKIPSPLFDTLENISTTNPRLPEGLSFAYKDFLYAKEFICQYDGSQATFNSYRREVERLLQWSWLVNNKSVLSLKRDDIHDYIKFCINPYKTWIGLKKVYKFENDGGTRKPNPHWRPFVSTISKSETKKGKTPKKEDYTPSQKSIKEIFVCLGSFYSYLVGELAIEINPISTMRQKSKFIQTSQSKPQAPRLSKKQWEAVIKSAKRLAQNEPEIHERTLFMLSALYFMYLRISELVVSERHTPLMKHFYKDRNDNWWFTTVGKGNKERHIPAGNSILAALKRWRRYLDLNPELPYPTENYPLIPKIKGRGGISSTRWVNQIIQVCFDRAVQTLKDEKFIDEAEHLSNATVHWLRHTGISDDINERGRPLVHVRDDAGHSSIATTDHYNNITMQERHDSAKEK